MARIAYTDGSVLENAVIQIWDDISSERAGMLYRAFWCDGPDATTGSPVVGYCSPGGSHRTIEECVRECRKLGYSDPIYRNGRLLKDD